MYMLTRIREIWGWNLHSSPWRTFEQSKEEFWTQKHRDRLQKAIPEIKFGEEMKVSRGKIVILGPIKSGKSSFTNSVCGIKKGRITQKAPDGGGEGSLTKEFNQFKCGNYVVGDTMGLEIRDQLGFNIDDIVYLLKGNVPRDYQFDANNPITNETEGFIAQPTNADKVHCVIFCLDAEMLTEIKPEYKRKIQKLQDEINKLKIPRIMILTKVDQLCPDVYKDISNTFRSGRVQQAVKKASETFNLKENYIHPVKNFTKETFPEINQSILLLLALKQAVEFAQDFVEEQTPEK